MRPLDQSFNHSVAVKQTPKRPKAGRKTTPRVTLRLTEDELAKLQGLSAGMSVSVYIRQCLFGKEVAPRKVRGKAPVKDYEALAQVLGLVGQSRMANNLNQLAYHANIGALVMDEATEQEIKEACATIAYIRVKLIEALGLQKETSS